MHVTIGRKAWKGKVVYVECRRNGRLEHIDNKDESFLMVVLLAGKMSFQINGTQHFAEAPCFLCFNEKETPDFDSLENAEYYRIYFHPVFLNVNMTFSFIRSDDYEDIVQAHNLFLLKPFLEHRYIVPMDGDFLLRMQTACEGMEKELAEQSDWYWSCRSRSYFMEVILALERMDELYKKETQKEDLVSPMNDRRLRTAMDYMESHYSESLTLEEITKHCGLNHTTLNELFKQEMRMTVMEYLTHYRIKVARKHLAYTELPLKEIADRCGFKTVQHFSRVFKEKVGETPLTFRREAVEKRKREIRS